MDMTFKLQVFEGPLDLLLHLIDINRIDIYDIPISLITDQYLDYIHKMHVEDMELSSEFLVMAATLLRIKSRMLLPQESEKEEGEETDPREDLVRRLTQYRMYKSVAQILADRSFVARKAYFREMSLPPDLTYTAPPPDLDELTRGLDLKRLQDVYEDVMRRSMDRVDKVRSGYGRIVKEQVSFAEKVQEVRTRIREEQGPLSFRGLLEKNADREDVIVTFLVILELMKDGTVRISQKALFDDIEIEVAV